MIILYYGQKHSKQEDVAKIKHAEYSSHVV